MSDGGIRDNSMSGGGVSDNSTSDGGVRDNSTSDGAISNISTGDGGVSDDIASLTSPLQPHLFSLASSATKPAATTAPATAA
jgi:hypothetical protein